MSYSYSYVCFRTGFFAKESIAYGNSLPWQVDKSNWWKDSPDETRRRIEDHWDGKLRDTHIKCIVTGIKKV